MLYSFSFSFLFHCSVPSYRESSAHKKEKIKTIRFELEVCLLPRLEMLGKSIVVPLINFGPVVLVKIILWRCHDFTHNINRDILIFIWK